MTRLLFLVASAALAAAEPASSVDAATSAPVGVAEAPSEPASTQTAAGGDVFAPTYVDPSASPAAAPSAPAAASTVQTAPEPGKRAGPQATRKKGKEKEPEAQDTAPEPLALPPGFKPMRAVHLTAWVAGAPKARRKFLDQISGTFINAVVVPLKETDGRVYIPGVARAYDYGTMRTAIPDPGGLVADLHSRGLLAVARIVVFKDNMLARKHPELGVRRADGSLWRNKKGITWVDPYRREIWEYAVDVALTAAKLGFDEIHWDYIRFPSDGATVHCRYSRKDHTKATAIENLREFLRFARARLAPTLLPVSVAVFGMTTTAQDDMGIGQDIRSMAELSDYVSPMMYPSHYRRGEYDLSNPNREPYKVIFRGLRDAKRRLGKEAWRLRPYLQDFSLGYHYGPQEVQAELIAAQKQGIESFILWNPGNHYTWKALQDRSDSPVRYGAAPASR